MDKEQDYRFVIHDQNKIYSQELDLAVRALGGLPRRRAGIATIRF